MCNPYDIANYRVSRQPPDHTAQTRSHGTNQVTRDKSGTKRDLQAPHGGPGYGVTVHMLLHVYLDGIPIYYLAYLNSCYDIHIIHVIVT